MSKSNRLRLASLALAGLSAVACGNAVAASMTVDSNGGLEVFELDDTNYWFKIGGRLYADTVIYEGGEVERSKFPTGSRLRHVRLTFKGGVGNNWVYKVDFNHQDEATRFTSDPGLGSVGEAFIAYNGCKNIWIALGQVGIPYSLEGWASSNDYTFMEAAHPIEAFAPNLGLGLYAEWHSEMFTLAGAIYHPRNGSRQTGDVLSLQPSTQAAAIAMGGPNVAGAGVNGSDPGSDPIAVGGRLTFSPVHDDQTVYHAGLSYRYQNLQDNANRHNFWTPLEVRSRQAPVIFTNIPLNSVQNYSVFGAELAGRWGPLMASAEYVHATAEREGLYPLIDDPRAPGDDLTYYGYYVSVSYVITGESKDYDFVSGTFGRVRPKSSKGAWEIAARHSYVKLLDLREFENFPVPWTVPNVAAPGWGNGGVPLGGIAAANMPAFDVNDIVGNTHSTTVGVTWWVNENVRLMANYARMNFPRSSSPMFQTDIDINAVGFRAQVNW